MFGRQRGKWRTLEPCHEFGELNELHLSRLGLRCRTEPEVRWDWGGCQEGPNSYPSEEVLGALGCWISVWENS